MRRLNTVASQRGDATEVKSMLWLAASYLEHKAAIQEGVMNFMRHHESLALHDLPERNRRSIELHAQGNRRPSVGGPHVLRSKG